MVIVGLVEIAIYLDYEKLRWDGCAKEPIVVSLGGCFTDQRGKEIDYDPNAKSFENK